MRIGDRTAAAVSVLLLFGTVAAMEVRAEQELSTQVDQLLAAYDRPDSPGCSIGIIHNGEMIHCKGFGSANLDHEALNTPRTIFETGSFAKSITCACIALLMDQGEISSDDNIRDYVPELHDFDPPIRIKHLIRCRSGIWAQWHIAQIAGWYAQPIETPYTENDMLTLLAGQKSLPFEPGTQFQYGTGDYFLLGVIIKRVTGQSLAEFAKQNLFEPLGMSNTFIMQAPARIVKRRAVGYYQDSKGQWLQWTQGSAGPGGRGLYTCVEDLFHWSQNFHQNRLPLGKHMEEFLNEGTLLDNRNVVDARPLGMYRGLKRIQFTGGMPGYVTALTQFPDQRFAVICLCNNPAIIPWEINSKIADLYLANELGPEAPKEDGDAANRIHDRVVEIDERELADKVGVFRLRVDGRIWKIVLKEGELMVVDHLNESHPLIPMGRNRFRPEGGFFHESARFIFERKSTEFPFTLTSHWVGGTLRTDRVVLVEPTSEHLQEYIGDFHSDELSTTYRFRVSGGTLLARVNNLGWEPLDPTIHDEFVMGCRQAHDNRILTFMRNQRHQVVGLTVTLFRVKGVSFAKVESPALQNAP